MFMMSFAGAGGDVSSDGGAAGAHGGGGMGAYVRCCLMCSWLGHLLVPQP